MTQPEALRLADLLGRRGYVTLTLGTRLVDREIAAELRRLYADNEKKSEAIQRLWKERDELRDSNEAKADRIDRLGETVEKLKAQRDELLEALKLADAMLRGANMDSAIVQKKVEAAIAKAEGKT